MHPQQYLWCARTARNGDDCLGLSAIIGAEAAYCGQDLVATMETNQTGHSTLLIDDASSPLSRHSYLAAIVPAAPTIAPAELRFNQSCARGVEIMRPARSAAAA